ncbi:hypothetical protein GOODEAATRI_029998, partial [Goodea atripinnis]
ISCYVNQKSKISQPNRIRDFRHRLSLLDQELSNLLSEGVESLHRRSPTEPSYVIVIHDISIFSVDVEEKLLKLAVAQGSGANKINCPYHGFHNVIIFQMFGTQNLLVYNTAEFYSVASFFADFFAD